MGKKNKVQQQQQQKNVSQSAGSASFLTFLSVSLCTNMLCLGKE